MSEQVVTGDARVREAIGDCLEACHGNPAPMVKLAECVETLRAEGWEASAIHRVEMPVLKMLLALQTPDGELHGLAGQR